jgi:hypothetical protein
MIYKEVSTRMYGKLIRNHIRDIKIDNPDIKGVVNITRLKKYEKVLSIYGGEVDIIFKGEIRSSFGNFYDVSRFRPVKIRKYLRSHLQKEVSTYTCLFGVNNIKIKSIKFE